MACHETAIRRPRGHVCVSAAVAVELRDAGRARAGRETAGRYTWAAAAQAHLALYARSLSGGG